MRILRAILLLALVPVLAQAAPSADLWERWVPVPLPSIVEAPDNSAWNALLARHLRIGSDGINRFAYAEVDAADRQALDDYVEHLASLRPTRMGRDMAMAYWINLYNALTVRVVLAHYPVATIRDIDISPGLLSDGPWGAKLVAVEGVMVTLDNIEHRILRPIWQDPRIHYAVNCASIGCPNLQPQAFTADGLDTALDRAARAFINHKRAVSVENGALIVSSIFDWFAKDFGGSDPAVIAHLRQFAAPDLAAQLAGFRSIEDDRYDWRLNAAGGAGKD